MAKRFVLRIIHSQRGVDSFVYKKNDNMMKRLGYGK